MQLTTPLSDRLIIQQVDTLLAFNNRLNRREAYDFDRDRVNESWLSADAELDTKSPRFQVYHPITVRLLTI